MVSSQTQIVPKLEFYSVTGGVDDSFVGIKFDGNTVKVFHPECYPIKKDPSSISDIKEQKSDILTLLRTISIAKSSSLEHSKAYNSQNDGGDFALHSYLWVINDYLATGLYVNREKTYRINQNGKINWKRTMQSDPIVSDKSIVFPTITVEKKSVIDNILVDVHKLCVKKSIDYIGWLFNLSSDFLIVPKLTENLKSVYVNAVQQELDHTFLDNKRILLHHMKSILNGLDERSNNKEFVYGVDSYYYVFERMIDSIFSNVNHMSDFYPSASWHLVRNDYERVPSSKLRPDTIVFEPKSRLGKLKGTAFILDSKFYRFGYTGNEADLPETTSIQKQITYGEFLKSNAFADRRKDINIENVYNAFIIPFDKNRGLPNQITGQIEEISDDLYYIGFAKSNWKDTQSENGENRRANKHEIIHAFLIDLKHVIHTWNSYDHEKDVADLVGLIVEKQELMNQ